MGKYRVTVSEAALLSAREWAELQVAEWDRERERAAHLTAAGNGRLDQLGRDYYEQAARHLRALMAALDTGAEGPPALERTE